MKRSCGVLLPVSSLPSNYGIGTFGKEAYDFIDFLVKGKQSYWQMLPIGPTSYGDSPYQCFSSFAGNPYFIDLDLLVKEKLLKKSDLKDIVIGNESCVDYGYIYNTRWPLLKKAYQNKSKCLDAFETFKDENPWLKDYSLFMALKSHFDNKCWIDWPLAGLRKREEKLLKEYEEKLAEDIDFYSFVQFLFYKQFNELKEYAHAKGIKLIGDLPIYVPLDSCDVWSNPDDFQLDEDYMPKKVAGVPPDDFTADGQLWGNPLYDYKHMKSNGYKWWIERVDATQKLFDVVRIDHFRGFESYWAVPYGDKTAKNGAWEKGPGMDLVGVLEGWFYWVEFIAEDLGYHTPEVQQMLDDSKLPGMKVLQFAFDDKTANDHAPHLHKENSVCYVGTHDNHTCLGYYKTLKKAEINNICDYFDITDDDFVLKMIKAGMRSSSNLFVVCMQDLLELDDSARINEPGTFGNNWKWRLSKGSYDNKLAKKLANLTIRYARSK